MNVNFYEETATLYINGVTCAIKKTICLESGYPEDCCQKYFGPINEETRHILTDIFNLSYWPNPLFRPPYYEADWFSDYTTDKFKKYVCINEKLFENNIESIVVNFEYVPCNKKISMKELFDYPCDMVIEYLKERGITTLMKDSLS